MKTEIAFFNYIGEIELPKKIVKGMPMSGPCDSYIEDCLNDPMVKGELSKIRSKDLIKELSEYGAWDNEELKDHNTNLMRILWIAIGDIQESLT